MTPELPRGLLPATQIVANPKATAIATYNSKSHTRFNVIADRAEAPSVAFVLLKGLHLVEEDLEFRCHKAHREADIAYPAGFLTQATETLVERMHSRIENSARINVGKKHNT